MRYGVGVCDVSTLGKIDIQGADALALLERVYINNWSNLPIGKARYGVMLREDGFVMDDGTTSRLGETHFLMTTTTANAVKVMQHLEFCQQVLWPDARRADRIGHRAMGANGDRRAALARSAAGRDRRASTISPTALLLISPRGRFRSAAGSRRGCFASPSPASCAYELAVPAGYGDALARAIMAAGRPFGVAPYGIEALGVMRVEKGHVAGSELNGQTTARDLGLARMMSGKKDFIGRVMAGRAALVDPDRPILAGFKPVDRTRRLRAGAHFLGLGRSADLDNDEGYMTSVAYSPILGHWIGLGLIKRGAECIGERVRAYDPVRNGDVEVEICNPVFLDAEGARLRG